MSVSSYLLDLNQWNVKNNGTDAINTSKGINDALVWAYNQGIVEFVLPKGVYLIDENNPIKPQSFMTLNLGGATLKIRENGLEYYSIVSLHNNQQSLRITNGKIEGDKDTHNYSSGGTHEGGYGIQIGTFAPLSDGGNNTRNITIDNIEIFSCTGDAITVNSTFGQIFPTPTEIANSWEQGSISTTNGSLIVNNNKIRSTLQFPLNQPLITKYGYFGLYGNGYGGLGNDITCDYYDVYFYKSNNLFLTSKKLVQFFDEVDIPLGANYARVVLHQSNIPDSKNCLINVRVPSFPQFTYIEKCNLHHCRRQGISLCGTKNIFIRDNSIHHIGGTPPQAGIDVEDGYDLNQFIYIERNNFHHNNSYDLVIVNGKSISIKSNIFSNTISGGPSLAVNAGADNVLVEDNNFQNTKGIIAGNVTFSNNNVYGTQLSVLGQYYNRPINLYNNLFHNSKLIIDNPFPYLVKVDGCRFFNDSEKLNAFSHMQWTIELKNEPQFISNCIFEGMDVLYLTYTTYINFKGGWIFENNSFINVKNPALFAGTYKGCTFKDITFISIYAKDTDTLKLINCEIFSKDKNNSLFIINNIKSLILTNCIIEKPNGTILRLQNITDSIMLSNNTFGIINDSLSRPIIHVESNFTGNLVVMENNFISSKNLIQSGITNSINSNAMVIIKNNILQNANINSNGKEIEQNNIIY